MPYNQYSSYLEPLEPLCLAGPDDLAKCLINGRRAQGVNASYLSDAELSELIRLAFNTSLRPDEGRYPRFRLFAYESQNRREGPEVFQFTERHHLSLDQLRHLVPALKPEGQAIRVDATDGQLWTDRIISLAFYQQGQVGPPGRPEFWVGRGYRNGLLITVDGPGEMRVSESAPTIRLRGGEIRTLFPFWFFSPIRNWLDSIGKAAVTTIEASGVDARHAFGGADAFSTMLSSSLERILERVIDARHGGAVVILPTAGGWQDWIHFGYSIAGLDILAVASEYWQACIEATNSQSEQTLRRSLMLRNKLIGLTDTLAGLTGVDGCVGLTSELLAIGFGGDIVATKKSASQASCVFRDIKTDDPWEDQSGSDLGGTRHRSAFRLCKTVPNTIAFVVSQDGDLTIFQSNERAVWCVRGLTPGI